MAQLNQTGSTASLQFFARLPINPESHFIPKTSIHAQVPKWYQFKLRSILFKEKKWLGCLDEEIGFERSRIILADEGGVGKTKSAAICANYVLNNEYSKPVLILVEPRQRKSWFRKLRKVLPRHLKINWEYSAKQLMKPRDGVVYVCSKYSLHENLNELKKSWKVEESVFSLVIIDECHKMKPGDYSSDNEISANKSGRNYLAERLVCENSNFVIGMTASPLGIEESDVWNIGKKLGIPENRLNFFNSAEDNSSKLWDKWIEINEEHHYNAELEKMYQNPESITKKSWHQFVTKFTPSLLEILPIGKENSKLFEEKILNFDYSNRDNLFELLSELNPFSPCMCITLRSDLGAEAEEIFRKMTVRTIECKFDESILNKLNEFEDNRIAKRLHSHPNVYYRLPNNPETFSIDLENEIDDPRLAKIIDELKSLVKNRKTECIGAVIFTEYLDTVDDLKSRIESMWDKEDFDCKPALILQDITSKSVESDYQKYINESSDKYPFARSENELHVVVGTSAIEQGVDMPWANLLIHWDLPYNPRRLEQRTWRLDRHKEKHYTEGFDVVYFWTGYGGLKNHMETLLDRVVKYDKMLGRPTEKELWPLPQNSTYVRKYSGQSKTFLHSESEDLATKWRLTISPESNKIMKIQQQEIFRWICQKVGAEIDGESLEVGRLKLNGPLPLDKSSNDIKKMSLFADGHDHEAIVELAYLPNHGDSSWLGIDGFEKQTNVPRSRIVSINPRGKFIHRATRNNEDKMTLISHTNTDEKVVIFSIDPIGPENKYFRCLPILHSEVLLDYGFSNLFKLDSDGDELRFESDEVWLKELLESGPFNCKQVPLSGQLEASLLEMKDLIFAKTKKKFEQKFQELISYYDNKNKALRELQSKDVDTEELELYETRLKRTCNFLQEQMLLIATVIENELSSSENYTANIRLMEV